MTSKSVEHGYKPLETLTIEVNGNPVPALSSYFAESRLMVPFSAPPKLTRNGQFTMGAKDNWLHKMNIFKTNIEWLLGLNHHKFWSQIVYGAETWDAVVSFLQEAHPFYAADSLPQDEEIMTVYHQIYLLVFKVLKRAMTKREGEMNYIGKKYGSLLYNYTIISVPMMIDICVLYGHRFHKETKEMIDSIFATQPLYTKDLENSVQTIKAAFSIVEEKFTGQSVAGDEITKLTERVRIVKTLPIHDLQDTVFYLLDISASLTSFLEIYDNAAAVLHSHKFETYISRLYENAFPPVVHQVQNCFDNDDTMNLYFTLMLKLNNARFYFIKLFHLCVKASLKIMFEKRSEATGSQAYLDIMTECLPYTIFIKDYHSKYPIDHDLDAIAQNCPDFDNIKYSFLLESLLACFNQPTKQKSDDPCFRRQLEPKVENRDRPGASDIPPILGGNSNTTPTLAVIQSKISEVKDCLPHLGDGFILKCLEHYDMTPTSAIMAILEETLPEEIKCIDPELPFIPPEQNQPALPRVHGDGEYENICQDFETEFVAHIGKRQGQQRDLKELLDDKTELRGCMDRFSQLGIIESMDDVYDDEYDDTYDDSELPVPEVEETDRKFVVPRVLQQGRRRGSVEEEDADDGEEEEESEDRKRQRSYMNFVENPEDVRARHQQKRLSNMKYPPAPKKDVVGNAKGQGQEKDVLRNRQQKTVNKSSNRKKAAQFKKSKGMF